MVKADELKFEPVANIQPFEIKELEVQCRV
jgi:hypothetical protein